MPMTLEQLEAAIGILQQRMAQLPTKSQIQTLNDLINEYKTSGDALFTSLENQVTTLQAEVADLKNRVYALENP